MLSVLEDLREAREQLGAYRSVADGLVVRLAAHAVSLAPDGRVASADDATLRFLGIRPEDVIGRDFQAVLAGVWARLLAADGGKPLPAGDDEWRSKLTPEQYAVLRKGATERPFTGAYVNDHGSGMFACAACGQELFSSDTKFDSGTGWPSFTDPVNQEHVTLHRDDSGGMVRTEVRCARCGSHLGHVFDDGPAEKGGKRYCINSVCLLKKPMP